MRQRNNMREYCPTRVRVLVVAIGVMVLVAGIAAAQDTPLAPTQSAPGDRVIPPGRIAGVLSNSRGQASEAPTLEPAGTAASPAGSPVSSRRIQRITLELVKQQQLLDPSASSPVARLSELSIEAAKQHRLGAQADYFPKIGATFANLHYSEFLGQVLAVPRPVAGTTSQVALPLFSQNQTFAAVTFVQPITPLFQVYQVVQIARADERIARAKAGASITKNKRGAEIEEVYFKLLIAQRKLTSAEAKLKGNGNRPLYATTSIELARTPRPEPEAVEANQAVLAAANEVRQLTASLNRMLGWAEDTELDLVLPDPLVEHISFEEVAAKPIGANPEMIEAEQTVVKARAATVLSKLAYVPTVAAVSGYLFQNVIPLVPSNFGYGGVMVSYNLFDFGKRERAVKEARAQLGMAEIAEQLTQMKVTGNVKKTFFELERSRQLSGVAQKMGSSMALLMNVRSAAESMEVKAARADVEVQMLEADLAHRQAFARLKALMNPEP